MALRAAVCPHCKKEIQVPADAETSFCAYCGASISVSEAVRKGRKNENARSVEVLRRLRQKELDAFFSGPGTTSAYHRTTLPTAYNEEILDLDPDDIYTRELIICSEFLALLYEICGEKGVFVPGGRRFFGNKVFLIPENETHAAQRVQKINQFAGTILRIRPDFDFSSTKNVLLRVFEMDKTEDLYGLFWSGPFLAYLALRHYLIPMAKKKIIQPLGDRLVEALTSLILRIKENSDEKAVQHADKTKLIGLEKLSLLKD